MAVFFNPDFEIYGAYVQGDLDRAERAEKGRIDFDAEKDCPYDHALCRQKLVKILNWERAVEYMALNRINNTFCTSGDMFHPCQVPNLDCIRRRRYENLLATLKEQQSQK